MAGKRVATKYPTSFAAIRAYGISPLRLFSNEDLQNTVNKMKEGDKKDNAGEAAARSLKGADGVEKTEIFEQQAPQGGDITLGLKYRNTKSRMAAALLEDGPEEQRDQYRALQAIFIGWPKRLQDM
jgi:hypothetical protein